MVKPRLSPELSKNMYGIMQSGYFGETKTSEVVETGCSWWKGPTTNRIAGEDKVEGRVGHNDLTI
jgi:hypothetical protein